MLPVEPRSSSATGYINCGTGLERRKMQRNGTSLLIAAAGLSFGVAALHIVMIPIGSPAYLYFGAPDLARLDARGSVIPALITSVLVVVFAVFGLYALSGAGRFRSLPLLKLGLVSIGTIYTLRGLIVVLDLIRLVQGSGYPVRQTVFSAVSLTIGLAYLVGTIQQWDRLAAKS